MLHSFFPIPHKSYWPEPNFPILHPNPTLLREKGRLKSSRIRNEMDWKEPSVKFVVEYANKRDMTTLIVLENLKDTPLRMLNELFLRMFDL